MASKKNKNKKMSVKSQIAFIKERLRKKGIEPDLIDVESLVDKELTYRENLQNVMNQATGKAESSSIGSLEKEYGIMKSTVCSGATQLREEIKAHLEKDKTYKELGAKIKEHIEKDQKLALLKKELQQHLKADARLQELKAMAKDAHISCRCSECQQMGLADPHINYAMVPEDIIIKDGLVVQRTLPVQGDFKTQLNPKRKNPTVKIGSPEDIYRYVKSMQDYDREFAKAIYLDTKNNIVGLDVVSVGSLNAAVVHPREVFKGAILNNAAHIIFVHNHPSGNPEPSKEDITLSQKLKETGDIIGIYVIDSLVVGKEKYYSMKESLSTKIFDPHPHIKERSFFTEFEEWLDSPVF